MGKLEEIRDKWFTLWNRDGGPSTHQAITNALHELQTAHEKELGEEIDERASLEAAIGTAAAALGCEQEWSNVHDHRQCLANFVYCTNSVGQDNYRLTVERDQLLDERDRLAARLAEAEKFIMSEARITLPWKHIAALFARRARNWRANFRSVGADNAANIRERDHLRADNDAMSRRFMAKCSEMDAARERLERAEALVDGMHRGRIGVNHFSVRAFLAPVTGEAKPAPRHALVSATVAAIAEAPSFEGARRAEHEFMPTDGDAASCATRPKKRTGL